MKKTIIGILIVLSLILFVSCGSTSSGYTPAVKLSNVNGDDVADVSLEAQYAYVGLHQMNLSVRNKSNDLVFIDWSRSSIIVDGNSSTPFIGSQKYIEASTPMPSTLVPVNGTVSKVMYASSRVTYTGHWYIAPFKSFNGTVIICIEHGGGRSYYTFDIAPIPEQ